MKLTTPDPLLKLSFDSFLKRQEVYRHDTFPRRLTHDLIETPSGEAQVEIYFGTVRQARRCPLERTPARTVGEVIRVSGQHESTYTYNH